MDTGTGAVVARWARVTLWLYAAILALAMPVVWGMTFMGLPEIADDADEPKVTFFVTLSVAMPLLLWALLRTDGHLAGTRRRWRALTLAVWAVGLALPAYGFLYMNSSAPS